MIFPEAIHIGKRRDSYETGGTRIQPRVSLMRAINSTRQIEIASSLNVADSLFSRMKGLLGRSSLEKGEGLLIRPCKGIHTFGMKFPIDAMFLDRRNVVIAINKDLASNRLTPVYPKAASVLELPCGTIEATATNIGDEIILA